MTHPPLPIWQILYQDLGLGKTSPTIIDNACLNMAPAQRKFFSSIMTGWKEDDEVPPIDTPTITVTTCLRCNKPFNSVDPKRNRICRNCSKSKSYKEACRGPKIGPKNNTDE